MLVTQRGLRAFQQTNRTKTAHLQAGETLLKLYLGGFAASLWDQVLGLVALIKDDEPIETWTSPVYQLL